MEHQRLRDLFIKFLLGKASDREIHSIENWYASFDQDAPAALPEGEASAIREEIWAGIEPFTKEAGETESEGDARVVRMGDAGRKKPLRVARRHWLRIAAVLFLLAGAAGGGFWIYRQMSCVGCSVAYTLYQTGVGEKKWITLADSSRLLLDAASSIRVADDFSKDRKIELMDGEAFFDVKHDPNRPFIVKSDGLTTRVLGTSFTISSYHELKTINIGVVSGRVSVADSGSVQHMLEKDQEVIYDKAAGTAKLQPLDESLTAWQEGRLMLNDLSFEDMAVLVKKNFGIEIVTDLPAVKSTRYTTELLTSMPPARAVEVLAAIHNLRIAHKNNKTFFY